MIKGLKDLNFHLGGGTCVAGVEDVVQSVWTGLLGVDITGQVARIDRTACKCILESRKQYSSGCCDSMENVSL